MILKKIIPTLFLFNSILLIAQIKHPKASPYSKVEQKIGFTTVAIDYSRPAVNGRKIFGDLVPYNRIWRVGANASTKITVDSDIKVAGNLLKVGTYALYAFPEENEWQIAFHSNSAHWGDGRTEYDARDDVFRICVKPEKNVFKQENFLITFDDLRHDSANMIWLWEETKITIPISVDTHSLMMREIKEKLQSAPTAQSYYEAARYLQEKGIDYDTALRYLNKAIKLGGDTYYFHRVKSLVAAALKSYETAIKSAEISLRLAEAEGKDEFVRMNEKSLKEWHLLLKD